MMPPTRELTRRASLAIPKMSRITASLGMPANHAMWSPVGKRFISTILVPMPRTAPPAMQWMPLPTITVVSVRLATARMPGSQRTLTTRQPGQRIASRVIRWMLPPITTAASVRPATALMLGSQRALIIRLQEQRTAFHAIRGINPRTTSTGSVHSVTARMPGRQPALHIPSR